MNQEYKNCGQFLPSEVLEKLKIEKAPFDPFLIAEKLGIKVDSKTFDYDRIDRDHSGYVRLDKTGAPYVWVNPLHPKVRQNFTLAHEIGHVLWDIVPLTAGTTNFDDDYKTVNYSRDGSSNVREYSANEFAGKLLMPSFAISKEGNRLLDQQLKKTNKRTIKRDVFIDEMSKIFKVSKSAMAIRLMRLGIIEE